MALLSGLLALLPGIQDFLCMMSLQADVFEVPQILGSVS